MTPERARLSTPKDELLTLLFSTKWLIYKDKQSSHIKRTQQAVFIYLHEIMKKEKKKRG